jgi:hypothetical protein
VPRASDEVTSAVNAVASVSLYTTETFLTTRDPIKNKIWPLVATLRYCDRAPDQNNVIMASPAKVDVFETMRKGNMETWKPSENIKLPLHVNGMKRFTFLIATVMGAKVFDAGI